MHSLIPHHIFIPVNHAEGGTSALDSLPTQPVSFAKECIESVPALSKNAVIKPAKSVMTFSGDMNGGSTRASITKNIKKERRLQGGRILTMTALAVQRSNIGKCAGVGRFGRTRSIYKAE